ncbi:hypothetical protein Cni_G02806 [Canna indica]|uniref:Uncharacterized protein n=1 Tax=Canna indica TaxID=4628 RepID=A0AAQ3Q2S2_9LILI|nr:hypothetical protein Cni_G02806 [Canna indica]
MDHYLLFVSLAAVGIFFSTSTNFLAEAQGAGKPGINYGLLGDNLPAPDKVVELFKQRNIRRIRLFQPDGAALKALHNSGIEVIVGTTNGELPKIAQDPAAAAGWVKDNIVPHASSVTFRCIAAGNEVFPSDLAQYVGPAMENLDKALADAGVRVPVSTAVSMSVMGPSPIPSTGVFSDAGLSFMSPYLVGFLEKKGYPLLLNAYPYFAYDPKVMSLEYALLGSSSVIVQDGDHGYTNLLHAMVDTVYSALEKVGAPNVEIVLTETGWPSGGGPEWATVENARIHNSNAVALAAKNVATPKRPGKGVETYVFATFNENQKPEGTERHYGLFNPDMTEVYHVEFP